MSEQKMRDVLQECVNGLDDVMLELGYNALLPEFSRAYEALRKGREALAQQQKSYCTEGNCTGMGAQMFRHGAGQYGTVPCSKCGKAAFIGQPKVRATETTMPNGLVILQHGDCAKEGNYDYGTVRHLFYAEADMSKNAGHLALATPAAGVELTDREMPILPPVEVGGFGNGPFRYTDRQMLAYGRAVIAAHEAKKNGGL